ncbi:MAG: inositol monophosphatase [Pseudomonadota bacterium]
MNELGANDPLRLRALEAIARDAGMLAHRYFIKRDQLKIELKGPQDLVSEADREVEKYVRTSLRELFPNDAMLGEEHGLEGDADQGCWVIDPIDGTFSFLNGLQSWCVSIAYVRHGQAQLGVIYDPNARELFSARLGGPATLNGQPIRVADVGSLNEGSVFVGFSHRRQPHEVMPALGQLLEGGGMFHREGSGALGLAWTAAGRLIGYVEAHMMPWDCLAGLCLIEAAGGNFRPYLDDRALAQGNPVVAGPTKLLPELERLLTAS